MADFIENPPWLTKTLAANWAVLSQQKGGADWMPHLDHPKVVSGKRLNLEVDELGCGAYGCVVETNNPGIVMKITTDETEADFVTKVLPSLRALPEGIATYYGATKLSGHIRGSRAVALWRESAMHVGLEGAPEKVDKRTRLLMHHQHKIADAAFVLLHSARSAAALFAEAKTYKDAKPPAIDWKKTPPWKQMIGARPGGKALAMLLNYWRAVLFELDTTDELHAVATALLALAEQGVLMADVHEGNIGLVKRPRQKRPIWVITDPGHTVVLPSGWPP